MEGKENGAQPIGLCRRLFNFLAKNLSLYPQKQLTTGRKSSAESEQNETEPFIRGDVATKEVEKDLKSEFYQSVDVEGEAPLVPPIVTIPVEQVERVPLTSAEQLQDEKKKKSIRINSGTQQKDAPRDDKGQDVLKRRVSTGKRHEDDGKSKDKELKKEVSHGRLPPPVSSEGEASLRKPAKSVERAASNIDKKVDAFIQERKKSFAS